MERFLLAAAAGGLVLTMFSAVRGRSRPPDSSSIVFSAALSEPVGEATFVLRQNAARDGRTESALFLEGTVADLRGAFPQTLSFHSQDGIAADDVGLFLTPSGFLIATTHALSSRWTVEFAPGESPSMPLLTVNRVFVGSSRGSLSSFKKRDGKLLWRTFLGDGEVSSPVLFEDAIYVTFATASGHGGFAKLAAQDGRVIWRAPFLNGRGLTAPTLDVSRRLIFAGDRANGAVIAASLENGERVWQSSAEGAVQSIGTLTGGHLVYTSELSVQSFDPATGVLQWRLPLSGSGSSSFAPFPASDLGFVGSVFGGFCLIDWKNGALVGCGEKTMPALPSAGSPAVSRLLDEPGSWALWLPCGLRQLCVFKSATMHPWKTLTLPATAAATPTVAVGSLFMMGDGRPESILRFSAEKSR